MPQGEGEAACAAIGRLVVGGKLVALPLGPMTSRCSKRLCAPSRRASGCLLADVTSAFLACHSRERLPCQTSRRRRTVLAATGTASHARAARRPEPPGWLFRPAVRSEVTRPSVVSVRLAAPLCGTCSSCFWAEGMQNSVGQFFPPRKRSPTGDSRGVRSTCRSAPTVAGAGKERPPGDRAESHRGRR